ncbi:MAG: flagellar protein FlaG [Clostridiales bacterium]|nr:flagellar protein FlaG [Clostridiales bacterium]
MSNAAKHTQTKKNNTKTIGIVVFVLVIIAAAVFLFKSCSGGEQMAKTPNTGIVYDTSAVEGGWDEADVDKIIEGLNEKVEKGMINISMNTSPSFENGTSAGSLMIVNEGVNRYPQVVEITRNDTNEVIYKSGAIPVGSKIESAKLSVDLDAGTYDCTAMFYNVDPDTGDYLGCAGAIITVTVLD